MPFLLIAWCACGMALPAKKVTAKLVSTSGCKDAAVCSCGDTMTVSPMARDLGRSLRIKKIYRDVVGKSSRDLHRYGADDTHLHHCTLHFSPRPWTNSNHDRNTHPEENSSPSRSPTIQQLRTQSSTTAVPDGYYRPIHVSTDSNREDAQTTSTYGKACVQPAGTGW